MVIQRIGVTLLLCIVPLTLVAQEPTGDPRVFIKRLGKDYAPVFQKEAESGLIRMGPAAIPMLIESLHDADEVRRIGAIEVLGEIHDQKAERFLLRSFEANDSVALRSKIIEALGKMHDHELFDFFAHQAELTDSTLQGFALWALGELRDRRSVPILLKVLRTQKGYARIIAINALGKSAGSDVASELSEYLQFDDTQTRYVTALAMGEIADARHVDVLFRTMLKEPDSEVQEALAKTLGKMGGESAISNFIQLLKENPNLSQSRLAEIGLQTAGLQAAFMLAPLLREGHPTLLRIEAAKILGAIRAPGAVEALVEMMDDEDEAIQVTAVMALGDCGDLTVMNPLTKKTKSKDSALRQAALESIQKIAARRVETERQLVKK